jgi:hypothetical protein
MNEVSPKLEFCASVVAFFAAVTYGVAQIAQILGVVSYPLADILSYGASLCLSVPFLIAMLSLHDTVESRQRLWTSGALLSGYFHRRVYAVCSFVTLADRAGDVDAPVAGVDGGIETTVFGGSVLHTLAMGHIDEIEGRARNEILRSGLAADIGVEALFEPVLIRVVKPYTIGEHRIDASRAPCGRRSGG